MIILDKLSDVTPYIEAPNNRCVLLCIGFLTNIDILSYFSCDTNDNLVIINKLIVNMTKR